MNVKRIELDNYKALAGKHEFDLQGHSFYLLGGNGMGKSSVGRLVMDILTKNLPSQPVTEGEKQGYVEITLDNGDKIYYRFSDTGKPVLEIIAANGGKYNNVSELFKTMSGEGMHFDINEFLRMAPKPRRAMLEKIAGVDFTDINNRERKAEDDRKAINARLKDAQARVKNYDPAMVTKERINTAELSKKLTEHIQYNNTIIQANTKLENLKSENNNILAEIDELNRKIAILNAAVQENTVKIFEGEKWISANKPIAPEILAEINNQIAAADETNRAIDSAQAAQRDFEFAQDIEVKSVAANALVKEIRAEKDQLIQSAKMPAAGLSFSDDGETLLIDGLPFEDAQIATSRKMIAAIQIAESMLGSIRFLHLDGSVLDRDNAEKLLQWAEEKGLQLAVERSLWEGGELKYEIFENSSNG